MWDRLQPAGVDWPGDRPQETQAVLQVPNPRAGEGVPLQRVRLQAEEVGAREEPEPHGATSQDLVPEPADEEQEEHTETGSSTTK